MTEQVEVPLIRFNKPVTNPNNFSEAFYDASLRAGGNRYRLYRGLALATGVRGTVDLLDGLIQPKIFKPNPVEMTLVGTNANDTCIVLVTGIDGDGDYRDDVPVQANGTTPVSIGQWLRVFRIEYAQGDTLQGGLYVYDASEGPLDTEGPYTYLHAPATVPQEPDVVSNRSYSGHFMTPKGYETFIGEFQFFADRNASYSVWVQARNGTDANASWQTVLAPQIEGSYINYQFRQRRLPELWEARILVKKKSGSNNAVVGLDYQMLMIRKEANV